MTLINVVKAEPKQHILRAQQHSIIPPLSAMSIRVKVMDVDGVKAPDGDVLVEALNVPLNGSVPRQLRTIKDGTVDVLITNTAPNRSLMIAPGMAIAKSCCRAKLWRDEQGVVLSLDELHARSSTPTQSPEPEEEEKKLPRSVRRALSKKYKQYVKVQGRLNNVDVQQRVKDFSEVLKTAKVGSDLSESERKATLDLIKEYEDLFSIDIRTTTSLVKHDIVTTAPPIKQRPYRVAHSEKEFVSQYISEGLKNGIIRKSNSPWSSPILLVQKKDGTKRFCVDYRQLNAATKKDIFPIPLVDDILERLDGMKYFSKFDLVTSYYQIEMEEEAKEKTAFVTEEGSFEYNVMPFGLTNAPATFQRLMNLVLAGINLQMCLVYIDDILVFSRTFEQHLKDIRVVFDRLRIANLKLKFSKCEFAQPKTVYLGHTIGANGVETDPDKISVIQKWQPEHLIDIAAVRSFLGLTGYYRRFIKNYAQIAAPISDLLRKNKPLVVDDSVREAFIKLRDAVCSAPVLAYPKWNTPFVLQCDASNKGIGVVLTQYYGDQEHAIAYFSRRLDKAEEKNYATMEKECLAIVEGIKHFRPYLYGYQFTVITDHKPLEHIDKFKAHNGRVARWRMMLSDYHFDVVARPGHLNGNADALSRFTFAVNAINYRINIVRFGTKFPNTNSPREMRHYQRKDTYFKQIGDYLEHSELPSDNDLARKIVIESELYCLQDGVLYNLFGTSGRHRITSTLRLAIPEAMRLHILHAFHDDPIGAHQGISRTYELVASRYYWPGMYKDVNDHVRSCVKCIARKTPRTLKYGLMQPITVTRKHETVGVDVLGPLPITVRNGYQFIIVFTEYFTKLPMCIPARDQTAATIAKAFVEHWYHRFGAPERILSDRGSNFMSELFLAITELCGSRKVTTTAYHPQTDGLVERFNHTLCVMLSTFCHDHPRNWDQYLLHVEEAYRHTKHPSTGVEPDMAMMGFIPRTFMDLEFPPIRDDLASNVRMRVLQERETQRLVKEEILVRIKNAQLDQQEHYNKSRLQFRFIVGDRVWFYWPSRQQNVPQKLTLPWSGPYYIHEQLSPVTYRITRPDGKLIRQIVNADRLKMCSSTLGPPTEFVSLHVNDTFDLAKEREDIMLEGYGPVIDEMTEEAKERQRLLAETDPVVKPTKPSMQRYQEEYDRLIKEPQEVVPEGKKVKKYKHQRSRLEVVGNRLNKYKRQAERKAKDTTPRFYERETVKPTSTLSFNDEEVEFIEPMHKKDLYNALKNVYQLYHHLPPTTSIAAAKKMLHGIFESPFVTENYRIQSFSAQIRQISNYEEFIDFIKNCLVHFEEIFNVEIKAEQKLD